MENTLATAVSVKVQNPSFDTYTGLLQQIRYRNGQIQGYPSRLHYFSEWLYENEKRGFLQVITKQLGGKPYVKPLENKLQDGDVIAITTGIQGLDVVHVGFAKWHNNRIHLLHASLDEKKVVISSKPLAEYLLGNKSQSGIMVARVVEK
jgi:hypothetical protein